ncbi:efflux RND transporter periplasmic adaptor subunit [Methylobacterium sp. C25]|uniref:efflux RND transporter periplasmic adaptor subunit n=1 Tax=Methylobacterium sp. C25 TaxID=2721622 RepID=UPI001F19076B|nr:efflux RND transporter periplasmic adaptor subunit [Methylobacterium sp. C25]MCE4224923.1 efflux RND transporter periplasmic adaptor subunit [Methylobacterium sp. C25]
MSLITVYAYLQPDPDAFLPIKAGCRGCVKHAQDHAHPALRSRLPAFSTIMTVVGEEIAARQAAYLNQIQARLGDAREAAKASLRAIQMTDRQIEYLERKGTPSRFVQLKIPFDIAVDHVLSDGTLFEPGDRLYSFARWEELAFRIRLPRDVAGALEYRMTARVTPTRWGGEPIKALVVRRDEVGDGEHLWVTLRLVSRACFPDDERCRIEISAPRLAWDYPPPVARVMPSTEETRYNRFGLTAEDLEALRQRGRGRGIAENPDYKREQALQKVQRELERRTAPPLAKMKPLERSRLGETGIPRRQLNEAEWKKAQIRTTKRQTREVTPQHVLEVALSRDPNRLGLDPKLAAIAAEALSGCVMPGVPAEARTSVETGAVLYAACQLPTVAFEALSGGWLELAFRPAMGQRFEARGPIFETRNGADANYVQFGLALPAGALHVQERRNVHDAVLSDPDGAREVLAVHRSCLARVSDQTSDGPDRVIAVHTNERELAFVRVQVGVEGLEFAEIEPAVQLRASEAIVYGLTLVDIAIRLFEEWERLAAGASDRLRYRANLNRKDRKA